MGAPVGVRVEQVGACHLSLLLELYIRLLQLLILVAAFNLLQVVAHANNATTSLLDAALADARMSL